MTKSTTAIALMLALSPVAPSARAQDPDPHEAGLTEYTFDNDRVHAVPRSGKGEVLHVRKRRDGESLVRVRTQFIRELLRSVERL